MIKFTTNSNFSKLSRWFKRVKDASVPTTLDQYGQMGVDALMAATPIDTGNTAASWFYEIERAKNSVSIIFKNSNVNDGVNVAIILQYGHATGTGGYVEGIDYINPSIKPIFEQIAEDAWKEVTNQ